MLFVSATHAQRDTMHEAGAHNEPTFDIRTRSGRIAGPFTRETLKRYANENRLDPRSEIRKHDQGAEHPWRPCWKTKGLFPPEVVEACAQGVIADVSMMGEIARIEAPPEAEKPARVKRFLSGPRAPIAWHLVAPWMVIVPIAMHVLVAVVIGLGEGGASAEELGPFPVTGVSLIISSIIALFAAVFIALFYLIGFQYIREPVTDLREVYGTALYTLVISYLLAVASDIALHVSATPRSSDLAVLLRLIELGLGSIAGVGIVIMRHHLGPVRALLVYLAPMIVVLLMGVYQMLRAGV